MCFIVFALRAHPDYPLIIAANRDEFFARQSLAAHRWSDGTIAGKDIEQGGTWLGVNKRGQFAAITNYRAPELYNSDKKTRGRLPLTFLMTETQAGQGEFSKRLVQTFSDYNPFNLLFGDARALHVASNVTNEIIPVPGGVHALSNHLLNTPWPKVVRGKRALEDWLQNENPENTDALFDLLKDDSLADDEELPGTGVDKDSEKSLSSVFVRGERYGTRCSTLVLQNASGLTTFIERSFDAFGNDLGNVRFEFQST